MSITPTMETANITKSTDDAVHNKSTWRVNLIVSLISIVITLIVILYFVFIVRRCRVIKRRYEARAWWRYARELQRQRKFPFDFDNDVETTKSAVEMQSSSSKLNVSKKMSSSKSIVKNQSKLDAKDPTRLGSKSKSKAVGGEQSKIGEKSLQLQTAMGGKSKVDLGKSLVKSSIKSSVSSVKTAKSPIGGKSSLKP